VLGRDLTDKERRIMRNLDVIADPVRLRILRHLAEHGPATGPELADAAGVHRNTVRGHLQELESAGVLVAAAREADGPGRPGVEYRLADEANATESDFRRLAELITTALARQEPDDDQLRRTGEDWGRYLVGRPGAQEGPERVAAVLRELGFVATSDGAAVRLSSCPCPLVSPGRPEMVCRLIDGAIAGVLAATGSPLVTGKATHDPAARRCSVRLVRPRSR
jgi:predicted ArsR family transcriptional regulator